MNFTLNDDGYWRVPENSFLRQAGRVKRRTPVWAAAVLALTLVFLSVTGGAWFVYVALFPNVIPDEEPVLAVVAFLAESLFSFAPLIGFLWVWLMLFEHRSFMTLLGRGDGSSIRAKAIRGMVVGFLLSAGTILILAVSGTVAFESREEGWVGVAAFGGVLAALFGYAVQAPAEELLCRGWLLQTAGLRYGPAAGIVISSIVFALWHVALNPDTGVLGVFNLVLFGVLFALYVLREGSLWGVCAMHIVYNWTEANFFGFDYYGEEPAGGSLLNLREAGPDLLTGGSIGVGITGGLATTVVVSTGLAVLILRRRIQKDA